MATLHLPAKKPGPKIVEKAYTKEDFKLLESKFRKIISINAKRALHIERPDVILTLDKILVISRDEKPPKNHVDYYKKKKWNLKRRYPRPEYEYTLKPTKRPTLRTLKSHYRKNCETLNMVFEQAVKENIPVRFGPKVLRTQDAIKFFESKQDNLQKMIERPYYPPTREIVKKLVNTKTERRKEEKRVIQAIQKTYSVKELRKFQKFYEWREWKRERLALMAAYFNYKLNWYREKCLAKGIKFSKVRKLRPCLDLNHEVYYRSRRDKYIPEEVFNHTFNPFPTDYRAPRFCYPSKTERTVQTAF